MENLKLDGLKRITVKNKQTNKHKAFLFHISMSRAQIKVQVYSSVIIIVKSSREEDSTLGSNCLVTPRTRPCVVMGLMGPAARLCNTGPSNEDGRGLNTMETLTSEHELYIFLKNAPPP